MNNKIENVNNRNTTLTLAYKSKKRNENNN